MSFLNKVLLVMGILMIFGAVGHDDYMLEIGQYYPVCRTLVKIFIGFLLMIPGSVALWTNK